MTACLRAISAAVSAAVEDAEAPEEAVEDAGEEAASRRGRAGRAPARSRRSGTARLRRVDFTAEILLRDRRVRTGRAVRTRRPCGGDRGPRARPRVPGRRGMRRRRARERW